MTNYIVVFLSGAIVIGSLLLARRGYEKSAHSLTSASVYSGVAVGLGGGLFIYFAVSGGDLAGSIFVALAAAIVAGGHVVLRLPDYEASLSRDRLRKAVT